MPYPEPSLDDPYTVPSDRGNTWLGLAQSKTAVLLAVAIILIVDCYNLFYLFVTPGSSVNTSNLQNTILIPFYSVFDIFLVFFLLKGKKWARITIIIRLALSLFSGSFFLLAAGDYPTLVVNMGYCIAIFLLLTGRSTRIRIAVSLGLLAVTVAVGVSWAMSVARTPVEVESYSPATLNHFSLRIPANWQKSTDVYGSSYFKGIPEADYFIYDGYTDGTGNAELGLMVVYMDKLMEESGLEWAGWANYEYITSYSMEDLCRLFTEDAFADYEVVTLETFDRSELTPDARFEYVFTAEIERTDVYSNFYFVFDEDKLAYINMICTVEHWPLFEESWTVMKETATLY